LMLASRVMYRN